MRQPTELLAAIETVGVGVEPARQREPRPAAASAPVMVVGVPAKPATQPPTPKPASASTSWDLCGIGRVPKPVVAASARSASAEQDESDALPAPLGADAIAAAWPRVLAALGASGKPRDRAVALLLQGRTPELVQLAQRGSDPVITGWALRLCDRPQAPATCGALSARDLVQQAPDDANSWLLLAEREPMIRDRALRAAAGAPHFPDTDALIPEAVDRALPDDLPAYLRIELAMQAIGTQAAVPFSGYTTMALHCRKPEVEEPTRRALCSDLATMLAERGTNLMTLGLAAGIGGRAGWPPDKVAAMRSEQQALMQLSTDQVLATVTQEPYGCAAVEAMRSFVQRQAREGELGRLRHDVADKKKAAATR